LKIEITDISSTEKKLAVTLPQEEVQAVFDEKIDVYRKKIAMPGFRAGKKLPKALVVKQYGDAIRAESIEKAIDEGLKKELEQANVSPVSYGKMEDFQDDATAGITFSMTVEVDPEVVVGNYEGLGVTIADVQADDAEVDKSIEDMRRHSAEQITVERAAQKGYIVSGMYQFIALGGEEQSIPKDPNFHVEVGASATPGFDDALTGVTAGEEKLITFVYPEDHSNENFRGKKAEFKVSITEVKELKLPELDAEFAKKMGADDMDALRKVLSEQLLLQKKNEAKNEAHTKAIDILLERNPIEVPESRIRQYVSYLVNRYARKEEEQREPTENEVEQNREDAIREIRKMRILEYLSEKLDIRPKQKDVDARLQEMAQMYGMDFETFKNSMRRSGRIVNLREELKIEKTLDYLVGIRQEDEVTA
jgi:trigger factor